jgi:hypothetical protein
MKMNRKQQKILDAVFTIPTCANIRFTDIEKLVTAIGGRIIEGRGSRVAFEIDNHRVFLHRPHPERNAIKYQVELVREFLEEIGIRNE